MTLTPSLPAPLATAVSLATTASSLPVDNTASSNPNDDATGPRGVKRGRSEEQYTAQGGEAYAEEGSKLCLSTAGTALPDCDSDTIQTPDDHVPRKRGRPPKAPRESAPAAPSSATSSQQPTEATQPQAARTPQLASQPLRQGSGSSPVQASPPSKTTPKSSVIKALPTVRDHTTDQLDKEGDEYIPKERDPNGETKVDEYGFLRDERTYKCRTFRVQSRGKKLFMLATECARVLGYRDSYLLFNKNRSLHKIIASQAEKDDLISQDILPYSYRSRQIAIVTARSMFRQFGSRVIVNGRRVRDDYWESKAIKQGFTEEDLAGEKRPGGQKARDAAAAAAAEAASAGTLPALGHNDVVYSNEPHLEGLPPGFGSLPSSLPPLPMINPAPSDDPRMREYNSFPRPRQDLAGQPYQDRTQPSTAAEILNQATHTADFSKILNQQRGYRSKGLDDYWHRPREIDPSDTQALTSSPGQVNSTISAVPQTLQQDLGSSVMSSTVPHTLMQSQHSLPPQATYTQALHPQSSISQSPMRSVSQTIRPDQLHHRSPSMASLGAAGGPGYGYAQSQQWGQPPPQPSPLANSQHFGMPQYAAQIHAQQSSPSPHLHQTPPHHPSASPRHQTRAAPSPQLQGQQTMGSVGYPGATAASYSALSGARGMYAASPGPGGNPQFLTGVPPQQVSMGMGIGTNAALPGWPSTAGGPVQPGQPQAGSPPGGWPNTY